MPAIAVGAAIYGGSALAGGLAVLSTMQVVAAVGAIATGVGVVTGNKELTKIGAIAGLAGGIGAFAESQGWLAAENLASESSIGMNGLNGPAPTEAIVPPVESTYQPPSNAEVLSPNGMPPPAATVAQEIDPFNTTGLVNSNTPLNNVGLPSGGDVPILQKGGDVATSKGIFDVIGGVGKFMEENKMASVLGLNFLGGMFDEKKEAEANLYKSRAESDALSRDQTRQQMANANAIPDLTGLKIKQGSIYGNTTAPTYTAPRMGLMNSTGR